MVGVCSPSIRDERGIRQISQLILVQKLNYAITIIRYIGTIHYTSTIYMSTIYMYTPTLVQALVIITCPRYRYNSTDTPTQYM